MSTGIECVAVIVNYRTAELTIAAAQSLRASSARPPHIVVIDNASGDGSESALRTALPWAEVIESPVNGGYAGGSNAGLARAMALGATFVLLFNSDATIDVGSVDTLVQAMRNAPQAALANPLIVRADAPHRVWFGGSIYWPWAARTGLVAWKEPVARALQAGTIPVATGCALLIRTSALRAVGCYDTSFFGYAEDLDLSLRMRAEGLTILFVPSSRVVHQDGVTHKRVGGQALRQYLSARNVVRVIRRHVPWYFLPVAAIVFLVDHIGRFVLVGVRDRDLRAVAATLRGTLHGLFGGRHAIEPTVEGLERMEEFIADLGSNQTATGRVTA